MLRKEPMSKDVGEDDVFSFNEAFTSKLFKIKIGTVSATKECEAEKAETRHKVRREKPVCALCLCTDQLPVHSSATAA